MSFLRRSVFVIAVVSVFASISACSDDEGGNPPPAGDPDTASVTLRFVHGAVGLGEVQLQLADGQVIGSPVSFAGLTRASVTAGVTVSAKAMAGGTVAATFEVTPQVGETIVTYVLAGAASPLEGQRGLEAFGVTSLAPGMTRVVNALADDESVDITVEGETSAVASNGFADFTLTAESTVSVGTQGGVYPLARVVPQDVFVVFGTYRSDLTSGAFVRGVSIPTAPDAAAAVTVVPGERQFLSVVLDAVPSYGVETPTFEVPFNTISDAQFTPLFMKVGVGGALVFEETDNAPPQGTWVRVAAGLAGAGPGQTPPSVFTIDTGGMYATGGVYVVNAVADGAGPLGLIVDGTEVVTDVAYGMGKRIQGSLSVGGHAVKVLYDATGDGVLDSLAAGNFNVSATTQVLFVVGTFGMADTHHLQILAFDRTPLGTLTPVAVP